MVGRHGGEPVAGAFRIAGQRRHLLLDPQQRRPVLVVAVQRLDDEVAQVHARVVRVRVHVGRGTATTAELRGRPTLAPVCVHLLGQTTRLEMNSK